MLNLYCGFEFHSAIATTQTSQKLMIHSWLGRENLPSPHSRVCRASRGNPHSCSSSCSPPGGYTCARDSRESPSCNQGEYRHLLKYTCPRNSIQLGKSHWPRGTNQTDLLHIFPHTLSSTLSKTTTTTLNLKVVSLMVHHIGFTNIVDIR